MRNTASKLGFFSAHRAMFPAGVGGAASVWRGAGRAGGVQQLCAARKAAALGVGRGRGGRCWDRRAGGHGWRCRGRCRLGSRRAAHAGHAVGGGRGSGQRILCAAAAAPAAEAEAAACQTHAGGLRPPGRGLLRSIGGLLPHWCARPPHPARRQRGVQGAFHARSHTWHRLPSWAIGASAPSAVDSGSPSSCAPARAAGFLLAPSGVLWVPLGLAGSVLLSSSGFLLQTCGLKEGSTVVVCTCAAVAAMVSGVLVGLVGLLEALPTSRLAAAVQLASWAAVMGGVAALAGGAGGARELAAVAVARLPPAVFKVLPITAAVWLRSWAASARAELPQQAGGSDGNKATHAHQ